MISLLRTLIGNRRLLKELVVRDLKARYVGSSMGFFWSVIFPIINLIVYHFVFRMILGVRFDDTASPEAVAVWMLAGIVVWTAFSETLSRATNCLVENANLIQKVVFPAGVLPVFLTISSLINMAIGLPIVILGVLWIGYSGPGDDEVKASSEVALVASPDPVELEPQEGPAVVFKRAACNQCDHEEDLACPNDGSAMRVLLPPPTDKLQAVEHRDIALGAALFALPLLLFLQGLFTVGLGLFLSAFNLILRDTFHLIGVFTMVWMFGTPIFYPPEMLTKGEGTYAWILGVNPMYWLIDAYRDVLLYNDWPHPEALLQFGLVACVAFFLGSTFFSSQKDRFSDLL